MYGHIAKTPSIWPIRPSCLAFSVVASVRLPPPDSPETTSFAMPSSSRLVSTHSKALLQSFRPAGKGYAPSVPPALRNSTPTTTIPAAASSSRQCA